MRYVCLANAGTGCGPAAVRQKRRAWEADAVSKHPDVLIGSAQAEDGGTIEVLVTGVDVRLAVRRRGHDDVLVFLAADDVIDLVGLLERALKT